MKMRTSALCASFFFLASCRTTTSSKLAGDNPPAPPVPPLATPAPSSGEIWSCLNTPQQNLSFALKPFILGKVRGFLNGSVTLAYNCDPADAAAPVADGTFGTVAWKCSVVPGQTGGEDVSVAGIKRPDGSLAAHVHKTSDSSDIFVACIDNQTPPPTTAPTFSDVKTIIKGKCASCHSPEGAGQTPSLATLEQIKTARNLMLQVIESGFMPFQQPTWRTTPNGQKVIAWLKFGAEFQPSP